MTEVPKSQSASEKSESAGAQKPPGLLSVREFPHSIQDLIGFKVRVIHPNDMVTMDYNPKRVNLHLNGQDVISDITIG